MMGIEDDFGELYAIEEEEEEEEVEVSENESEDDLHILLNDEDCDPLINKTTTEEDNEVVDKEDLRPYSHPNHQYKYIRPQSQSQSQIDAADFCLPRHKTPTTILDVNIDAFPLQPWNHPGVDPSLFFNFGFHHHSWKHYCNTLQLYTQQQTFTTSNQTSRLNEKEDQQPKGRAIQVDAGIGERWPSIDIRRPQIRDSDVVIQISVHDHIQSSSTSTHQDSPHSAQTTHQHTRCSPQKIATSPLHVENEDDSDCCDHHNLKNRACMKDSKNMEASKDAMEKLQKTPVKEDLGMVEALHGVHASKMSFSDSDNEASTDGDAPVKERRHKHARKQFSNSASGLLAPATLRCDRSKELERNKYNTERRNNKDELKNQSHVKRERCNRARVRGVTDSKNVGDDKAIPVPSKKNLDGGNHLTKRSRKRERECENGYHDGEDLPYYKETEISYGYQGERFVGKPDAYPESFDCKGRKQFKTEMDPHLRRNWSERVFMHRETEARQREHFHSEKRCSNKKLNDATHDEYTHFPPEHSSVYIKEKYHWKRMERDELHGYRRGRQDDFVLEHRFREQHIQENFLRSLPNHDREREYINENYSKHASYGSPDRRDRYDDSPCMDFVPDSSWDVLQDDEYWRHPDHESPSTFTCGRRWHDAASRKSKKGGMGLWRQTDHGKHQKGVRFDSTWEDGNDDYFSDAERSYLHQCKTLNWSEDRIDSRMQSQGKLFAEKAPFSYERNLRHRSVHIKKYKSSHCGMIFDEDWFVHAGNRKIRRETRDFAIKPPLVDKDTDAQVAPRHKTSVDLHFVGWEGKASKCGDKKKEEAQKVKECVDSQRILETMAKMEKRRKRFDQPAAAKEHPLGLPEPKPEPTGSATVEQQRPARKRRWGGS